MFYSTFRLSIPGPGEQPPYRMLTPLVRDPERITDNLWKASVTADVARLGSTEAATVQLTDGGSWQGATAIARISTVYFDLQEAATVTTITALSEDADATDVLSSYFLGSYESAQATSLADSAILNADSRVREVSYYDRPKGWRVTIAYDREPPTWDALRGQFPSSDYQILTVSISADLTYSAVKVLALDLNFENNQAGFLVGSIADNAGDRGLDLTMRPEVLTDLFKLAGQAYDERLFAASAR